MHPDGSGERILSESFSVEGPTFANGITKTMLHQEWAMTLEQAIEAEAQAQALCMLTQDFTRAYEAFVAKRKPVFHLLQVAELERITDDAVAITFEVPEELREEYRFLAAGDNDAKDVDLEIQDPSGKVVASDRGSDPEAVVDPLQ